MEESTLKTSRSGRIQVSNRDRLGAWLYTGAPGRLASFSVDLALSLAALGVWSTRRLWRRLRGNQSSAA
jgi:hypothetical protein